MFPKGLIVQAGIGSYALRDEFISRETYSGTLPVCLLIWTDSTPGRASQIAFELRAGSGIRNYNVSASITEFTFSLDYLYPIGKLSLLSNDVFAYLGPSPDLFVHFRSQNISKGNWINDFATILEYFRNTKGLIIDIRDNQGGTDLTSRVVLGRFLDSPLSYPPAYINGNLVSDPNSFLRPLGPFRYQNRVVVLINGRSFSMAEGFAEQMKQISTVTVIGDTTAGAGGEPRVFGLPSGRQIRVSTKDIRRYDGQRQEWNGISPTVLVQQTAEDARGGRDKQLEYAIRFLR